MTDMELYKDILERELRINMVNVIGSLSKVPIDLEIIFKNFIKSGNVLGIEYNGNIIGNIEKKKSFANCLNMTVKSYYNNEERIMKVKVFKSGTIHIPGCKHIDEGKLIIKEVKKNLNIPNGIARIILNKTMYTGQFEFNITNIDRNILATKIREKYGVYCMFIPDKYPGLKIKYNIPKENEKDNGKSFVTIIFHRSGKVGIKGANYENKVYKAYNFIVEVVFKELNEIKILNNV